MNRALRPHVIWVRLSLTAVVVGMTCLSTRGATLPPGEGPLIFISGTTEGPEVEGMHVYRMNRETGAIRHLHAASGLQSPLYTAFHPSGKYLYSVGAARQVAEDGGAVAAYGLDRATGALKLINLQASHGGVPCHLVVDATGQAVLVANYTGGSVSSLPIRPTGELGPAVSAHRHESELKDAPSPHAHSINLDPENRFACAAELGLNQLRMYRFDPLTAALTPHAVPSVAVPAGSGPRHGAFHPNGKFLYMINETNCTLDVFTYDSQVGTPVYLERVSTIPVPFEPGFSTAELLFHPSGQFLYGSNRGHDTIVIFSVDATTGKPTLVGHESTQGKTPRNFGIDPAGRFLFVGNQESGTVVQFRIDSQTGKLQATGFVIQFHEPLCIKFLGE